MSTDQQSDRLEESEAALVLPETYTAEYLAEGAANIVYRIIAPASTPGESELEEYGDDTPPPTEYSPPSEDPFEGKQYISIHQVTTFCMHTSPQISIGHLPNIKPIAPSTHDVTLEPPAH